MANRENAVFTNLCMITQGDMVLVQDRKKPDWPGICFPGGHVEKGESFVGSVIREVYEETGLVIEDPVLCGTKQFQEDADTRYVVLFYKASRFSGQLRSSDEGEVLKPAFTSALTFPTAKMLPLKATVLSRMTLLLLP